MKGEKEYYIFNGENFSNLLNIPNMPEQIKGSLASLKYRVFDDEASLCSELEKEGIDKEYFQEIKTITKMNASPQILLQAAKEAEENYEYLRARDIYDIAKKICRSSSSKDIFLLVSIATNLACNKINAKKRKGIENRPFDEQIGETYHEILEEFIKDIRSVKEELFAAANKRFENEEKLRPFGYKLYSLDLIWSSLKKIEDIFLKEGLSDESLRIYKEIQHIVIEKYILQEGLPTKSEKERFRYRAKRILLEIWGKIFGFGVDLSTMFRSAVFMIFGCSVFFSFFGMIVYSDPKNGVKNVADLGIWRNIGHSFYYSVVSITNIGSETHLPINLWGRLIHTFEGLFGMVIFGAFIAYLTRRIK